MLGLDALLTGKDLGNEAAETATDARLMHRVRGREVKRAGRLTLKGARPPGGRGQVGFENAGRHLEPIEHPLHSHEDCEGREQLTRRFAAVFSRGYM
jgi:hypothetical protein